jgi:hypothetical protein
MREREGEGPGYAVPAVLRGARLVPRQTPGRREPARVPRGAFTAAGLPVPEHPAQRNVYQLTRQQGLAWTAGLDAHIRRRGGELLDEAEACTPSGRPGVRRPLAALGGATAIQGGDLGRVPASALVPLQKPVGTLGYVVGRQTL